MPRRADDREAPGARPPAGARAPTSAAGGSPGARRPGGAPASRTSGPASAAAGSRAKRALDVGLSGVGLLGSWPLWLVIAAAIRLEDGGPVFFRDRRVGRHGREFAILKFRTMVADADRRFGPLQATEHDPRVTRVGRYLRATGIDELPQLLSILRGDMSFVGPRALRPGEILARGSGAVIPLASVPGYHERHAVTPGLTGVAQIYADRDVPPHRKFRYDRWYARRRSFWLDVRLIALSFWITFRGRWEHRGQKV
jgi:lipopolysaccharide/colanic/teichoic acid biosynthesis glycosyltransferase